MTAEGWGEDAVVETTEASMPYSQWQAVNYRETTRKECIDLAIRCASAGLADKDVLSVAKLFEAYVFGGQW